MRIGMLAFMILAQAVAGEVSKLPVAQPLPENKPCVFPAEAERQGVAGVVSFVAQVAADGTTTSVEVKAVPLAGLGFEQSIRDCVSSWRFQPAQAGETGPRVYEQTVRFRSAPTEEKAIRDLLDLLATEWSGGNKPRVDALQAHAEEMSSLPSKGTTGLSQRIELAGAADPCFMELAPQVACFRFVNPTLAAVRQDFRCLPKSGEIGGARYGTLELFVGKGAQGWRFVDPTDPPKPGPSPHRIGGTIQEPKKLKNVPPHYPDEAKKARVQGIVILEAIISPEGNVTSVKVLRGIPLLDDAAMEAVRQWKYTPTLLNGAAVPVIMTVTVNFRLS